MINRLTYLENAYHRAAAAYRFHASPLNRLRYYRLKAAYKRELFRIVYRFTI